MRLQSDDVRNLSLFSVVQAGDIECPKCSDGDFYLSKQNVGAALVEFHTCSKCDQIMRLTSSGMQKAASLASQRASQAKEAERRRKLKSFWGYAVLYVVVIGGAILFLPILFS